MNHVAVLSFAPLRSGAEHLNTLDKATASFLLLFAFGHQAVVVFFVLSGFCIHYRQAKATALDPASTPRFDAKSYYLRRSRRILPPYYFALAYTALLGLIGVHLNPWFANHLTGVRLADEILIMHNDLRTLAGNIVFLQWLTVPTFGNNTPLWSLSYEFFFYVLYPVFLALRSRLGIHRSIVCIAVLSLSCGIALRWAHGSATAPLLVGEYWITWCLGCLAVETYLTKSSAPAICKPIVVAGLLLCWLASVRLLDLPTALSDIIGAAWSVLLVLTLLRDYSRQVESVTMRIGLWAEHRLSLVGRFSYSLYLTHVPLLCLICTLWFAHHHALPTNPLMPVISALLCVLTAWLAFQAVEKRTLNHA